MLGVCIFLLKKSQTMTIRSDWTINLASSLGPLVSQPFLTESVVSTPLGRNQRFRPETAEKRLDLTSYMSYMGDKGET